MKRLKLLIGKMLYLLKGKIVRMTQKRKHLERDTILISPQAWVLYKSVTLQMLSGSFDADVVYANISAISCEDRDKIIAYIGNPSDKELSSLSDKFRWLQITSHGYNGYDRRELFKNPNVMVSCVKNVYNHPIAQFCLTAYYVFNTYAFRKVGVSLSSCQLIPEKPSVMIYGLGNIDNFLATVFKCAGWGKVIGVKRNKRNNKSNDDVDEICNFEESLDRLKDIDYVVNILPESDATKGIFNSQFFAKMKGEALFCNVGRKSAVIDKDIAQAVRTNVIRGAILDAHNEYDYGSPNIILTGHKSALSADNAKTFDAYFQSQLELFMSGKSVENRII